MSGAAPWPPPGSGAGTWGAADRHGKIDQHRPVPAHRTAAQLPWFGGTALERPTCPLFPPQHHPKVIWALLPQPFLGQRVPVAVGTGREGKISDIPAQTREGTMGIELQEQGAFP